MVTKSIAALTGLALLASTAAVAQTVCEQCGGAPPPPPPTVGNPYAPMPVTMPSVPATPTRVGITCHMKGNAGIGNKGDGFDSELNDCDPGKSGLHNNAYKADKPKNK
jgi:hypothetical protein